MKELIHEFAVIHRLPEARQALKNEDGILDGRGVLDILDGSLFQYPTQNVIQLTDFVTALQETEHITTPLDEDELTDRPELYYEYAEVIDQVERAQRQFETDFDNLSTHLTPGCASDWLSSPS